MGAYSVSNDPREKIRLKMAQDELAKRRQALGGSQPMPFVGDEAGGAAPAPASVAPRPAGDMSPEMQQSYGLESHRRAIADSMRMIQLGAAPKIGTPERAELANQIAFHRRFLDNASATATAPHALAPLDAAGLHASQNDMDRQMLENLQRQGNTTATMSPEERAQRAGKMALYGAGRPDLARPGANPENAAEFQRFVGGQAGVPPGEIEAQAVERVRRAQQMEEIKTRMAARDAGGNPVEDSAQLAKVNAARDKENVRRSGEAKARQGTGELYRHIAGVEGQEAGVRMQIGRAEMQKKLAEAQYAGSPDTIKAEGERQRIVAQTELEKARQGSVAAQKAGSGPASPGEAAGREAQRQSGVSQVYGDEAHFQTAKTGGGSLLRSAVNSLDDLYADKNVGNSSRDYSTRFLPDLQRYASIDPVGAAQVAHEHLAEIERHISYVPGWATNSGIQARRAQFLGPIEQELRRIAGQ